MMLEVGNLLRLQHFKYVFDSTSMFAEHHPDCDATSVANLCTCEIFNRAKQPLVHLAYLSSCEAIQLVLFPHFEGDL